MKNEGPTTNYELNAFLIARVGRVINSIAIEVTMNFLFKLQQQEYIVYRPASDYQ
jgi:hypothetical protein